MLPRDIGNQSVVNVTRFGRHLAGQGTARLEMLREEIVEFLPCGLASTDVHGESTYRCMNQG